MDSSRQLFNELLDSIEELLLKHRTLPALILLYSALDSFAWLSNIHNDKSNRARFTSWVDDWIIKNSLLPCSSLELYAARNAILHHQTAESKLTDEGNARRIIYGINDSDVIRLNKIISFRNDGNSYVAVNIWELTQSFKEGINSCYSYIEDNHALKEKVVQKSKKLLVFIPSSS